MKPYNEQELNKLCAEFLGFEISENKKCFKLPNKNGWIELDIFHSDWNWIMEVVEKIEKTSGVSIVGGPVKKPTCVIHLSNLHAKSGQGQSKKEAVVQAIWEFLN